MCLQVLFAIAIPLTDLTGQSVFMSYNYQANYNMPTAAADVVPGPYIRFTNDLGADAPTAPAEERSFDRSKIVGAKVNVTEDFATEKNNPIEHLVPDSSRMLMKRDVPREGMFTRNSLYRIVQKKIDRYRLESWV